jgi:hypothetical protein
MILADGRPCGPASPTPDDPYISQAARGKRVDILQISFYLGIVRNKERL